MNLDILLKDTINKVLRYQQYASIRLNKHVLIISFEIFILNFNIRKQLFIVIYFSEIKHNLLNIHKAKSFR